ncbi:MAG: GNAT family N-acetyltransferase [Bacteroidales bacterium]|nr:GNAT family N-acetyltransferase [Bacteroidales bacterium]
MTELNYIIRRAKESDYAFLAEAILKADIGTTGTNTSYAALFGLSYEQARDAITAMMPEEVEGCEFSPFHFLVAEFNGEPVACVSAWIEGLDGVSSWMARSALMQHYYPKGALDFVQSKKHITDKMMVHRTEGTMQIESVFVSDKHRGKGLAAKLIKAHVAKFLLQQYPVSQAELMTYIENKTAIHTYEKIGFNIKDRTQCDDPDVLHYFPGTGMVLMQTDIMNLMKG